MRITQNNVIIYFKKFIENTHHLKKDEDTLIYLHKDREEKQNKRRHFSAKPFLYCLNY